MSLIARSILRLASRLVPRAIRDDWLEEWRAELTVAERSADGSLGPIRFALGSIRHALWERRQEWTMDGVLQDLRFGVRVLRRNPLFTIVAAATLALGIGSNAAVFSVVNGVLFKSVPGVTDPSHVVQLGRSYEGDPRFDAWSYPALRSLSEESAPVITDIAGYSRRAVVLGRGLEASQVALELVTGSYFQALGVRAILGRLIGPDDDRVPGAHAVVVLSHSAWTGRYGGSPSVLGSTILLNGSPHEVIGVAPAGFVGVEKVGRPATGWAPASQYGVVHATADLPFEQEQWSWLNVVGRLADGSSVESASAMLRTVAVRLGQESAYWDGIIPIVGAGVGLDPEGRAEGRLIAILLMLVAGIVLLIACANVANLLLARATTRSNELGIRLAMGAGRTRLARQLVSESGLLAGLGVLLSVPLAWSGTLLRPVLFPGEPGIVLDPDARVLAFAVATGAVSVLLFGLAPALGTVGRGQVLGLREARGVSTRRSGRLRKALVVAQLALSLALVTAAGMLWHSLWNVRSADPGFDAANVLVMDVSAGHLERYRGDDAHALYDRLLARIRQVPGVHGASLATAVPIADFQSSSKVRNGPIGTGDIRDLVANVIEVGPAYFSTLGVPLVRGSEGGPDATGAGAEPTVVVSETLASALWPGEDPIGQTLYRLEGATVTGVAAEVHHRGVESNPRPTAYYPVRQMPTPPRAVAFVIRTAGPPLELAPAVATAIAGMEPDLPVTRTIELRRAVAGSLTDTLTTAWLIGMLAGLALCLAAIGLYGILAFTVSRRSRELGIRSALGARPRDLTRLVVREGAVLAVIGVLAGLVMAWFITGAMRGLLFGVAPADPLTFTATAALLFAIALAASWVPARRAATVDVTDSLRQN